MHMPACLTHTKHTHAGCHPHSHTAFQTTWIGHLDSPQHLYSPSRMHTHPFHRPPWPKPQNWSCAGGRPPATSTALRFSSSLTPSTVFSGNWCLMRLLCTLFIYFLFLPPRPSCQESCSPDGDRQEATGTQEAEDGRRTSQKPPPGTSSSSSLPVAMSTRQETRREGGDSSRRGQGAELRDRAHLSQQRRLKQATQFLHKDSADLLPLDSLKRLGTSKDLVRKPSPLPQTAQKTSGPSCPSLHPLS